MNNRIKTLIFASALSVTALTSCEDFLTVNPDSALPPEEALSQQQDLERALNGMYYNMSNESFYGTYFLVGF